MTRVYKYAQQIKWRDNRPTCCGKGLHFWEKQAFCLKCDRPIEMNNSLKRYDQKFRFGGYFYYTDAEAPFRS